MKLVILGLSGVGKTTLAKNLLKKFTTPILEVDSEVQRIKVGENIGMKVSEIFDLTNKKVLGMNDVIYITSKLLPQMIEEFYNNGFCIIELHADYHSIIKRLYERDIIDKEEIEFQKYKVNVYMERVNVDEIQHCFTLRLDTSVLSENEVFQKVLKSIS